MKRLFSKKSGFTVVEIVMAFLIFAIMAGMILAVLRLAVEQRRSNNEFANDLDSQTERLVQNDKDKKSSAYDDGTITLDVGGKTIAAVDYATAGVTDGGTEDGINYFIGKYNDTKGAELTDDDMDGDGKAVNKRVDSRIYGSTAFKEIRMYKITRDSSYTGTGVRYTIECSAKNAKKLKNDGTETSENAFNAELMPYRQYILFFPNQNIREAGYVEGTIYKNAKTASAPLNQNRYSVRNVGKSSILISISKSPKESGDEDFLEYNHTKLYVVFDSDPGILPTGVDTTDGMTNDDKKKVFEYFGDNVQIETDGSYVFFTSASADTLVNNGKDEDEKVRCDNIYGVKSTPVDVGDPDEDSET